MRPDKAIIISTHLLEEVEAVCSRAIIIAHGRILADGTPAELAQRSRHHNAVRLGIAGGADANVRAELAALPGVAAVEPAGDAAGRRAHRASRAADTRWSAKSPISPATAAGRSPACRSSAGGSTTSSARSPPRRPDRPDRRRGVIPMRNVLTIFRRELAGYFATPLAYVFIVIFLVMAGVLTFFVGNFFERGQADLQSFFTFHPWLYVVLIPALSMRLWAEERRSGTIELFLTLPIRMTEAVVGKFLAAWCFAGIALVLTFPFWITVNFLGHPDNGVILASYIASWLMAGAFLAVGACVSAMTKNQVIAFVVTAALVFVLTVAGSPIVLGVFQGWAPEWLIHGVAQIELSRPFQRDHPRRHRSARPGLFPVDHDRLPRRQRDPDRPRKGRVRAMASARRLDRECVAPRRPLRSLLRTRHCPWPAKACRHPEERPTGASRRRIAALRWAL